MKLEQSFIVHAPIDRVWEALIDVELVAPCLPGAEITEASDDGRYRGSFTVKLGPTTAAYRGELEMESVDQAARTVTMKASGQDKRGQGGAKATIVSVLSEDGGATKVDVDTDFTITGRLARFGRGGMIKDISPAAQGLLGLPGRDDRGRPRRTGAGDLGRPRPVGRARAHGHPTARRARGTWSGSRSGQAAQRPAAVPLGAGGADQAPTGQALRSSEDSPAA